MLFHRFVRPVALLAAVCCAGMPGQARAAEDLTSQNLTSQDLTTKAWKALGAGEVEAALEAAGKCVELHAAEAGRQQADLDDFLPLEQGHDAWALNDVGTCLFIAGQAHEKAGRTAEAVAAYRRLVDDYRFCQCWDEKGWFWKPAQAAADRLEALDFDKALAE